MKKCKVIVGHNTLYDLRVISNYTSKFQIVKNGNKKFVVDGQILELVDTQDLQLQYFNTKTYIKLADLYEKLFYI